MSDARTKSVTLEDLIAVNDEIAALVRAGVPLEKGLLALGGDMPGGLGRITTGLARQMEAGQTLGDALAAQARHLPPVYRAVVEAGLRSGRLADALESLAGSLRRLADTRGCVTAALVYPMIVAMVAWGFFTFFVVKIAPCFHVFFVDLGVNDFGLMAWLGRIGGSVAIWGQAIPLAILLVGVFWWYQSTRAALVEPRWSWLLLGWLPWVGRMLRASRTATFIDVLTLLVESDVPLDQGMVLAAETTGDRRLLRSAGQLAVRLRQGESLDAGSVGAVAFPPLLGWLIAVGRPRGTLLPALRHASRAYHRRARHAADAARMLLPVLLTFAIGGTAVLLYALLLFLPYVSMLKSLGAP
jgi:type II secretory pathway component PulF